MFEATCLPHRIIMSHKTDQMTVTDLLLPVTDGVSYISVNETSPSLLWNGKHWKLWYFCIGIILPCSLVWLNFDLIFLINTPANYLMMFEFNSKRNYQRLNRF